LTFAKTEPRSEIIEVIDDDLGVFSDGAPIHFVEDPGGRRFAATVAALVFVALIGYGVATSATSNHAPVAAPITPTSVAATSPRVPTTTPPAATVPYYAANPPRQFTVQYANVQQLDHAPYLGYAYQLWATDGASATSGSWFSVATYRGVSRTNVPNAYRVQTDKSSIAISHTPGGQSLAQFNVNGQFDVSIASFGWTDDDLVRLAGSVQTDGRTISFTDSWFSSDHVMVTSVQPWLAVQSIPGEQISYASSDDPTLRVVVTVGKRLQGFEGGATSEREIALRFLLDHNTPFDVDGRSAMAGTIVGQRDDAMATWIDDDNVITVTAAMPLPELIDIARTVHQASPYEWEAMKVRALWNADAASQVVPAQEYSVAAGVDSSSQPWSVRVAVSDLGTQQQINWRWNDNGFVSTGYDSARINTVVDNERTYVLADLPRNIASTAQLQITRSGSDPVAMPFNDSGADVDRTFAAYAFSEPVLYSAQIIGADGAVLATWSATS
jgi:hypothetical protein